MLITFSQTTKVDNSDIYSFDEKDIPYLFNDGLEIIKVWKEKGQINSFNALIKKQL